MLDKEVEISSSWAFDGSVLLQRSELVKQILNSCHCENFIKLIHISGILSFNLGQILINSLSWKFMNTSLAKSGYFFFDWKTIFSKENLPKFADV